MSTRLPSLARHQTMVAAAGLVGLALLFHILHRFGDLRPYVVETIAVGLAAGVVYLVVLYALQRAPERRSVLWIILLGAALFRLQLFPLAPALSDDLYRYRWEGRIQSAAENPYAVRPDDPRLAPLRDAHWHAVPGRDIPSIYPPLAELIFRITYRALAGLPGTAGVILFKVPFLAADLLVVCLLAGWIRTTGGRSFQLAVYAWNPLVVVEFAASGHYDALALAAVLASALIIRRHPAVSTLLLAAGALLKAFPAVLLPLWLRVAGWPRAARSWVPLLLAIALAALCAWPYLSAWPQFLESLAYYESRWQHNNASLYTLLAWFADSTPLTARGSAGVATGAGIGVVAGLAVWLATRRADPVRAAYLLFGAILMLSPNAFPWYFTWMVPLLCFFPNPAWLLLTVLQFLSYHVLIDCHASGAWHFRSDMLWLTYGPFYALLLWQAAKRGAQGEGTGRERLFV